MTVIRDLTGLASRARRYLRPSPEQRALRRLEAVAARVPPHTPGSIDLLDLRVSYVDARSTVPQWDDLFVRRSLAFNPGTPAPRVLDCGANIGLATLWLTRAFPKARVTAFEADPAVAAVCARNFADNGVRGVELVRAAVWTGQGTAAFRAEGADSGALDAVGADTTGPLVEVPAVRLRDWVARERIDLLKLDIEGAELDVLRDIEDVLDHVRALQVEVHDFAVGHRRLPRVLDLLERARFACTLGDLHQATWRDCVPDAGPFPGVAAWVVTVRAWPRESRA